MDELSPKAEAKDMELVATRFRLAARYFLLLQKVSKNRLKG